MLAQTVAESRGGPVECGQYTGLSLLRDRHISATEALRGE